MQLLIQTSTLIWNLSSSRSFGLSFSQSVSLISRQTIINSIRSASHSDHRSVIQPIPQSASQLIDESVEFWVNPFTNEHSFCSWKCKSLCFSNQSIASSITLSSSMSVLSYTSYFCSHSHSANVPLSLLSPFYSSHSLLDNFWMGKYASLRYSTKYSRRRNSLTT